jgi:phytoene desaturase
MNKKVVIVGAGFGGLSTACYLARDGFEVTVIEKNSQIGGRAMTMKRDGYTFDLGPSWYMMPDVFEEFFADFGKKPSDFYDLVKLDPSYKVFTGSTSYDVFDAPRVYELFEQIEKGSAEQLKTLLMKTQKEYETIRSAILPLGMLKLGDALNATTMRLISDPELLGSYHSRIKKYVSHPDLQKILEFMVVFMGGSPKNIPALYTLLAYVDMGMGIWYPMGGMHKLAEAMYALASSLGVKCILGEPVTQIYDAHVETKKAKYPADIIVANADYHHVATKLLAHKSTTNWDKKVLSPSGLLIYLGIKKKLKNIRHHNLIFDVDWDAHFTQVFDEKVWSDSPMLYVGAPSVTDMSVAPKNCENLFVLAPMANGNQPSSSIVEATVTAVLHRLETVFGESFVDDIVVKEVRAHDYFKESFNAYKGNAFGLAHTWKQSAIFRPPIQHKTQHNLYFVGHYTNPGTGVPIVTLGGRVVAEEIRKVNGVGA